MDRGGHCMEGGGEGWSLEVGLLGGRVGGKWEWTGGGGHCMEGGGEGWSLKSWLIRGGENYKTFPTDVSRNEVPGNGIFVPYMIRLLDKTSLKRVGLPYGLAIEKVRSESMAQL
jgi:hypothetical protein